MAQVGKVAEIWRYPVKSMGGERLDSVALGSGGMVGDRAWACRDEVKGGIRGAKKLPGLMTLSAAYATEPAEGNAGAADITLPDGSRFASDSEGASAKVSEAIGREITLCPLKPADDLDHYRRGEPDSEDLEVELRGVFGRKDDEPLPDLAKFPPELFEYESPPGTYFDAYPLLVMTTASLAALQELVPDSMVDVRRFRPNVLVETLSDVSGFVEAGWEEKKLRIGDTVLQTTIACPRCVMVTLGFGDVPKDPSVLRAIVREADQNLGIYAAVADPGSIRSGDPVELMD